MTVASTVPAEETGPVRPGAEGQSSAPAAGSQANAIPEGFPAKFVIDGKPDYAALARSYQELEGRFTQKNQQQQQPPQNTPAPEQKQEQANQELAQGLANAGVSINDFQAEYARDGKLSDESYAKLAKAGYPRQFVDDHIRGQEALFERQAKEIFDSVG